MFQRPSISIFSDLKNSSGISRPCSFVALPLNERCVKKFILRPNLYANRRGSFILSSSSEVVFVGVNPSQFFQLEL